jgi:ubiquinone/menaquinone biosynthesis C-methylase UbiE
VELARRVAPHGKAVGTDIDQTLLELARQDAQQQAVTNVAFDVSDIREASGDPEFDLV